MNLFLELTYLEATSPKNSMPLLKQVNQSKKRCKSTLQLQKQPFKDEATPKKKVRHQWNEIDMGRYIEFLIKYQSYYDLPLNFRKQHKLTRLMSQGIKTRNQKECSSHHQKLMRRHGSVKRIISKFTYLIREKFVQPQHILRKTQQHNNQIQNDLQHFRSPLIFYEIQGQKFIKMEHFQPMQKLSFVKQTQQIDSYDQIFQ